MFALLASVSSADSRHHLGMHAVALAVFVARMQRRQLDRDAGVHADVVVNAALGDPAPMALE
jgi:hypothetical protein